MKFVRRANEEPSINLTPLIDVVFLLLIFFMVSTRFVNEHQLPLELPAAANAQPASEAPAITVRIGADDRFQINGEFVSGDALVATLSALQAQYPRRALSVRADADARHAAVVRVLDAAAGVGFARVDIATRSREH